MIKAVIFDCFGVLVQDTFRAFRTRHFADDKKRVLQMQDLDTAANRGMISLEDLIEGLAELAGISVEQVKQETSRNPADERLFEYIEHSLKPRYKIGFLSNVSSNLLDRLFTREQQAQFDDIVLSYQVQMSKPDPRIYKLAADRLGLLPEECVFVDDSERQCAGAEAVGMKSILYEDFTQFEKDIKKLLQ